ncbi:MAG TPA: hypothetical protein VF487_04590 [Chitinophagaceae bacterium]
MKKFFPAFLIVFAGIGLYSLRFFKKGKRKMLSRVADEGYETAIDVLYPTKKNGVRTLHYGPVIPD